MLNSGCQPLTGQHRIVAGMRKALPSLAAAIPDHDPVRDTDRPFPDCLSWGQYLMRTIQQQKPDIVILGQRDNLRAYSDDGKQVPVSGTLVQLWRKIEALGSKVVVIADTPYWGVKPELCLGTGIAPFRIGPSQGRTLSSSRSALSTCGTRRFQ
ncbi:hypothetical protein [Mesorhizobium caraganae]|uniref:hypothetical protein n=1 Tax=Mesorhizobium caraganae TaxID=483206 RepID=UPI00177D0F9C|nr:hypothetical protein [Mesorhizobium caraganae]